MSSAVPDMTDGFEIELPSEMPFEDSKFDMPPDEKKPTREPEAPPVVTGMPMSSSSSQPAANRRPINTEVVPEPREVDESCCGAQWKGCCGSWGGLPDFHWILKAVNVSIGFQYFWLCILAYLIIIFIAVESDGYIMIVLIYCLAPLALQIGLLSLYYMSRSRIDMAFHRPAHDLERIGMLPTVLCSIHAIMCIAAALTALIILFISDMAYIDTEYLFLLLAVFIAAVGTTTTNIMVVIGISNYNTLRWQEAVERARQAGNSGTMNQFGVSTSLPLSAEQQAKWRFLYPMLILCNGFHIAILFNFSMELFSVRTHVGILLLQAIFVVFAALCLPPFIYAFPFLFPCCASRGRHNGSCFTGIQADLKNGAVLSQYAEGVEHEFVSIPKTPVLLLSNANNTTITLGFWVALPSPRRCSRCRSRWPWQSLDKDTIRHLRFKNE